MRVLHVTPSVAARYGGASTAVFGMCQALQELRVECLIATTDADGPRRLPVEYGRPVPYGGVQVIFFPRQCSESFKYSFPLARWLQTNIRNFDLAHVHAVFSHSSLSAARACRRYDIPYVIEPLGTLDPWCLKQKRFRKLLLWYTCAKHFLRGATAIHYTTPEEKRQTEETLGLNHGKVIPLGVDEKFLRSSVVPGIFRLSFPSLGDDPYVITLSRLHPQKGLELFIQVFLEVTQKEEFRRWKLVIAGEGDKGYRSRLERLVWQQQGNRRVLFTGWLDGIQKAAALRGASLFVLPSYQESFGLAVVEAMACGIPVLVSHRVNLAGEIVKAEAGWVTKLDRESLFRTLVNALEDEAGRGLRGSHGMTLVQSRFRWSLAGQQLLQLYQSVIATDRLPKEEYIHSRH